MAAVMEGTRTVDPLVVEELKSPGSVMLSTNVVMFYAPSDGKTKRLIVAREDLEHIYSTKEQGGPVVTSLAPCSVLPMYFEPTTSEAFFLDEKEDSFRSIFS
jgi:hypothetical protein